MNKFLIISHNILKKLKLIYINIKLKLIFLFKKQSTLKNIYNPIIYKKTKEINTLNKELKSLKEINFKLQNKIKLTKKENDTLENDIQTLQELIINK